MQCRIKRAVLHLKKIVGRSLNVLADLVTVSWPIERGSQYEHAKRALQQIRPLLQLLYHGSHSTIDEK
jgi:hypothetical protein